MGTHTISTSAHNANRLPSTRRSDRHDCGARPRIKRVTLSGFDSHLGGPVLERMA